MDKYQDEPTPMIGLGASLVGAKTVAGNETSAVKNELLSLEEALNVAHSFITKLEAAVQPVSQPTPEADSPLPSRERIGVSPTYSHLHELTSSVHYLQDRISRVIRNLEV